MLKPARDQINLLLSPVYLVINIPGQLSEWLTGRMSTRSALESEARQLRSENMILKMRVQKLAELAAENLRLRQLNDSAAVIEGSVLLGEIIGIDPNPFRHIVLINKGRRQGIREGQPVLDAGGLMGQVIEVDPNTSRVLLITDESHSVPVRVNRNGVRAIVNGGGDFNSLQVMYVPDSADIQVGDLLLTSGLGGRFPAGYPVGTVTQVRKHTGESFASIIAHPMSGIDRARHVMFLLDQKSRADEVMQEVISPSPLPDSAALPVVDSLPAQQNPAQQNIAAAPAIPAPANAGTATNPAPAITPGLTISAPSAPGAH